jgi:DNA invertase Pin-like site-specific DNA recombinase
VRRARERPAFPAEVRSQTEESNPLDPEEAQKMKPVIELLRVSTETQAGEDKAGLAAQRAANRCTAAQFGLQITATIELIDVSGTSVLYAPGYQRLLEMIADPNIVGVVAKEFSRLVRPESWEDGVILQRFVDTGTLLYLPDGPLDPSTRQGRILATLQGLMAGLEGSMIRERMMAGKESMRRSGRWAASDHCLPIGVGYDRPNHRFFYQPEAEKVREVFRQFLAGNQNYDQLSITLGMARNSAKNVLENPIYSGWLVIDEKRDLSPGAKRVGPDGRRRDRRKIARSADEIVRVRVIDDPLVSQGDFDRVQFLIRQKSEHSIRMRTKVGHFTYNGWLWCAKCGERLHTYRNQFDRHYYICSNKKRKNEVGEMLCPYTGYMSRDKFEPILDHLFSEQLTDRAFLGRLYDHQRHQAERRGSESRVVRLRANLDRLESKRRRVTDLYVDGELSREEHTLRLAHLDRELREGRELLAAEAPMPVVTTAGLAELFAPFVEWPYLQREDKRRILSSLAPEIKAADYRVESMSLNSNVVSHPRTVRFALPEPPCR